MVTPRDVVHGSLKIGIVMKLKSNAVSVMIHYTDITNPYSHNKMYGAIDELSLLILVTYETDAKKTHLLTQVAIGLIVLVALIILIVVLIKTYKSQKGKYQVEKRLQQQSTPSVETIIPEVTPNSPSVHFNE